MPKFITSDLKGKELYFDLRADGAKEPEGFWATPIFDSDRSKAQQELTATGKGTQPIWRELLKRHIVRWQGFVDVRGKEIPCTAENIEMLCESDMSAMMGIFNILSDAANYGQMLAEKN